MSRKKEISQEEIAKQFLLPERKSKIATLLKQDGQAYCICRSSDSSRFMIGCDSCEEWYHGDCINITEKESKNIKQFFCVRCKEEDPTLQTRWKTTSTSKPEKNDIERHDSITEQHHSHHESNERKKQGVGRKRRKTENSARGSSRRCGECMGCYRTEDCGRCDACKDMKKHGGANRLKLRCRQRTCVGGHGGGSKRGTSRRRSPSSERETATGGGGDGSGGLIHLQTNEARQCYGPGCVTTARWGSKYCSDACGQRLATSRIYQVLPQRIQEWSLSPCVAEDKNRKALDQVRRQQHETRRALHELDARHRELDAIVERAKSATIDPKRAAEESAEDEEGQSMYCITCGHEIHSRTAIRHMEKCFNKYESQASFGSVFATRIDGEQSMFCDFYNPSSRTYCKRLRVLCPEHCKDPKVGEHEVCGCPLVHDVFSLTGEFCRAPKKSCTKHHVWEKLRRAEIDMERVRQWLRMDELIEQERQLRHNMASRAGVLALMLHSTYNHEIMERLTKANDQHAISERLAKRFKRN